MIIKELFLTSFGKFKNKSLKLQDGINIIYGDNEAGKTTIHKFIEGMLYGFFKPYTKRKIYTDDYDKYMPWNQSEYFGVLKYQNNDDVYKVERNFLKSNDEVKIYDNKTGENISHMFEYDNTIRLHQPTSLHLELNSIVYNNTISIKQLGNRTEEELAKEVKDNLINLGRSLDEDISVKNTIEKIEKKIDTIGTKGRIKTSPYGKITRELEKLHIERKKAVSIYDSIKVNEIKLNTIKKDIGHLEDKKNKFQENLLLIDGYKLKERYNESIELKKEIDDLEVRINKLKNYGRLDSSQYTRAIETKSTITNLRENITIVEKKEKSYREKLKGIEVESKVLEKFDELDHPQCKEEIDGLVSSFTILKEKEEEYINLEQKGVKLEKKINRIATNDLSEINNDFYEYESLEQKKNMLSYDKDYTNQNFLKARLGEKEKSLKRLNAYKIIILLFGLIPLVIGYKFNSLLYITIIIPVILIAYSQLRTSEIKKYVEKLKKQIFNVEYKETDRKEKIKKLNDRMKNILEKHKCNSKGNLRNIINEYSMDCALLKDKKENLKLLKEEIIKNKREIENHRKLIEKYIKHIDENSEISLENIKNFKEKYTKYIDFKKQKEVIEQEIKENLEDIRLLEEKYNKYNNDIQKIFKENKVKDLNEFKMGLEKKKEYETILKEKESMENLLKKVLGDNSFEFLRKKSEKYDSIDKGKVTNIDKKELKQSLIEIHKDIRQKEEELTRLEERIRNLSHSTRALVEIDEEITRREKMKDRYERKLKALRIAKESINNISKEIQRDFAPKLNKKVGNITDTITNGKYSEVKITEKLDIKVTDPSTEKLVSIDSLSGGTIDQLYFATRLGIISVIKGDNNVPLILDDCFTQYDIKRLEGILKFLAKEGDKRQIILFTCHKREKLLLDNINREYNYVQL